MEEGSIDVYFCPQENCEEVFSSYINEDSLCAFYDIDSRVVISKLRKSKVNPIVFYENFDGFGWKVYGQGLMHNKFCVSGDVVITGSANPTFNGLTINNNNLVVIKSKTIANNYREEYAEIKHEENFKTLKRMVNVSGILVENYFCPEDACEKKVLKALSNASKSIYFMTFSFTSDTIGNLLIAKSSQIDVRGVMESFGMNEFSEYEKFNFPVAVDRTEAMMHHKVFIIDNRTVITGSYNPTAAGNEINDENILIIHDEGIAMQYVDEFTRIFKSMS